MTPEQTTALHEFVQRYGPPAGEEGPVRMAVEVFGAELDPWQESVLRAYGRGVRRISIRACHGPGKTFVAALMIWNMLLTRFPQKTAATAPSKGQLEDALVAEVGAMYTRLPPLLQELFVVQKNRIELKAAPEQSFFSAKTARVENPEALQGVHSDHVLLIGDEASAIPDPIFESAGGSMSGENATTLLLSNPTRGSGYFYDSHNKDKDEWFTVHVSAADSSRVTEDFVRSYARKYGESSNVYRVRVLGEFPLADGDTVIPLDFVVSAQNRYIVVRSELVEVWGFDIARGGSDASALVRRNSMECLPDLDMWHFNDTMRCAGRIKAAWDAAPRRPQWILGDVIGWGAGVVDRLRELGLPVRGINVSEAESVDDRYANMRAQLWFRGRDWLATRDHKLPPPCAPGAPACSSCRNGGSPNECLAQLLGEELVGPRYDTRDSNGKYIVEGKKSLRKRGFTSPNLADAFLLTFAVDIAGMIHGIAAQGANWSQPIRRNRAMV